MLRLRTDRLSAGDQCGFTFVEVLVAMSIGLIVVGGSVVLFRGSVGSQAGITTRSAQIQTARTTAEKVTQEIRQAWAAPTATASQLSILTYVDSATCGGAQANTAIQCRVTYTCSGGVCSRIERNPDGSGSAPSKQVVSGLQTNNVFTYTPDAAHPSYVGLRLTFAPATGQGAVTVDDGARFGSTS